MSKFLVIAEKPSVAQSYAKNLSAYKKEDGYLEGESCIVSWCLGHLAEYAQPEEYDPKYEKWQFEDLPIIPEVWKVQVSEDKKKQFEVIKTLMNRSDVEYLVNGCDAGREGELIFKRVYDLAGCQKPVKRLWISSMEDEAIQKGFQTLKDGKEYAGLCNAAVCRAQADWLIGMNATRAYTTRYFKRLVVGRVQTPTLAMIVDRDQKVKNFVKEHFYETHLRCGNLEAVSGKFSTEEEAHKLADLCRGKTCRITKDESETKTVHPPKLYDLTTLQRDANRILGYTAQDTLDAAQSLYESKLVTYPRTDSQYLTNDMEVTAEELVEMLEDIQDFLEPEDLESEPEVKQTLNSRKVSDHHAIIPTGQVKNMDVKKLKERDRNVLYLIESRFLMAVGKSYIYETHQCEVQCEKQIFSMVLRRVKQKGFKSIEKKMLLFFGKKPQTEADDFPEIHLMEETEPCEADVREKWTQPPKQFTEDTLLAAMERAGNDELTEESEKEGMGTPATRAGIIEKLISSGFVARDKKNLIPTDDGNVLVTILPEELKSPKMTAQWEMQLNEIAQGKADSDDFLKGIITMLRELTARYSGISESEQKRFSEKEGKTEIGKCPRCGSSVYEGQKNFCCSKKGCGFALWKNDRFFEERKTAFTPKIAAALLKSGKVSVKGLYSPKTGKTYGGNVVLADTGGKYVNYRVEVSKKK